MRTLEGKNIDIEDFSIKHCFSIDDDLYTVNIVWQHDLGIEYPQVYIDKRNFADDKWKSKNIYDEELKGKLTKALDNKFLPLIISSGMFLKKTLHKIEQARLKEKVKSLENKAIN